MLQNAPGPTAEAPEHSGRGYSSPALLVSRRVLDAPEPCVFSLMLFAMLNGLGAQWSKPLQILHAQRVVVGGSTLTGSENRTSRSTYLRFDARDWVIDSGTMDGLGLARFGHPKTVFHSHD